MFPLMYELNIGNFKRMYSHKGCLVINKFGEHGLK
jgi:hypothetical protein